MRTLSALIVFTCALTFASSAAHAGERPEAPLSTTTTVAAGGGIIPKPNSGAEPQSSGDRGGSAQIALFVILLGGLGTIAVLARRSSLKARKP